MSASRGIGGHHSARAGSDEWLTPKFVVDALGPFDLDPATPGVQPWPTAHRRFTAADDGLLQPWPANDFVFLNPPYSKISPFMERLAAHGNGIGLVFARTETSWWFRTVWPHASAILFLSGRLTFCLPDGTPAAANSGGPSALVGYGPVAAERIVSCGLPGALVSSPLMVGAGTLTQAKADHEVEVNGEQSFLFT
jgi:phage N-6-adenine-methyltransferase